MITILCPTRGRPKQFQRMYDSAMQTAKYPEKLHISAFIGSDDNSLGEYPKELKNGMIFVGPPWSAVMAANFLATRCNEYYPNTKLYMGGADDMIFSTPNWDEALIDAYDALNNKIHVFALRDSRDENGTPHPIISRDYVNVMGYMIPPIFLHWFVDTWTTEIAKANSCFTHLKEYLLVHDKPSDKGAGDETYTRIRKLGWYERDKYVNDSCKHFLGYEKERLGLLIQQQNGTREHID